MLHKVCGSTPPAYLRCMPHPHTRRAVAHACSFPFPHPNCLEQVTDQAQAIDPDATGHVREQRLRERACRPLP